jgi:uncharacterized SAM-binding protein YcdF (DUF218 family)
MNDDMSDVEQGSGHDEGNSEEHLRGFRSGLVRGLCLFIGCFTLLNVVGDLRVPGFNANAWWIDLRPMPPWVALAVLLPMSVLLIAFGISRYGSRVRHVLTFAWVVVAVAVTLKNASSFYFLLLKGAIASGFPVPLSAVIALLLVTVLLAMRHRQRREESRFKQFLGGATALVTCILSFPLAQMYCFGTTDYARAADAIVVFGARAYADGTPSDALADRVRTACQLFKNGLAEKIVFSGGPGDGATDEAEAMRRMAVELGVPEDRIVLDPKGFDTAATVENTVQWLREAGVRRILAVSHFYHLPRVKMAYERAGVDVATVPAEESYPLAKMPYFVAREIVAFWAYYVRPLISDGDGRSIDCCKTGCTCHEPSAAGGVQ